MSIDHVYVGGLGMISPIGDDASGSCAAARAGISRIVEIDVVSESFHDMTMNGPPPNTGHAILHVAKGFSGVAKLLVLGAAAIADLLRSRPLSNSQLERTGLIVCVSDHAVQDAHRRWLDAQLHVKTAPPSEGWRTKAYGLAEKLVTRLELPIQLNACETIIEGAPGFVSAIRRAVAMLGSGGIERVIVGGVDSRIDPSFLHAARAMHALKINTRPTGLIGGEGAAFVLLERRSSASVARVSATGAAAEATGHFADGPITGHALTKSILESLAQPALRAQTGLVVADMNGTDRRALEWSLALTRLRALGVGGDYATWYPAASFGCTGAAAGPIAACMMVRGMERGYARTRAGLAWVQSESGASATFVVEAIA